jgi:class 3 adenylate cyclase
MGTDEEGTLGQLKELLSVVIEPKIADHRGRVVKTSGDGILVESASAVEAVRCAVEIHRGMAEHNATAPPGSRIEFRIGINVGNIIIEDGDIFGGGVNVASRLNGLAEPGGICISGRLQEDVDGKIDAAFADIGEHKLENIARPVSVFRLRLNKFEPKAPAGRRGAFYSALVVLLLFSCRGAMGRAAPPAELLRHHDPWLWTNANGRDQRKTCARRSSIREPE